MWLPSILYTWASEKLSKKIKKELEIPDPPPEEAQITIAGAQISSPLSREKENGK